MPGFYCLRRYATGTWRSSTHTGTWILGFAPLAHMLAAQRVYRKKQHAGGRGQGAGGHKVGWAYRVFALCAGLHDRHDDSCEGTVKRARRYRPVNNTRPRGRGQLAETGAAAAEQEALRRAAGGNTIARTRQPTSCERDERSTLLLFRQGQDKRREGPGRCGFDLHVIVRQALLQHAANFADVAFQL